MGKAAKVDKIKILKRAALTVLALTFAGFAGAFAYLAWEGDTRPMVAVADKFKPLEGWAFKEESIVPPKNICMSDVPCPSMWRVYSLKSRISQEDFVKFVKQGGFEDSEIRECKLEASPYSHGRELYCSTKVKNIDGYKVGISSTVDTEDESYCSISISIEKED